MSKLEIQNISVEVEEKFVVQDVSFVIESNSVSVVMGPNGSGKSTLVNALMGHPSYKVVQGKLLLDGVDLLQLPTEKRAQQGLFLSMQQVPRVGGITLATFLHKAYKALHPTENVAMIEFYLKLRTIADSFSINPTLLDRPLTAGLSGGEKKLSEVLQLAALKPKFAILDEIDSGVDVDALHKVFKAIDALKKEGTGFIVISHHPSLLDHMEPEHVHVMSAGRLARTGGRELAEEIISKGFCSMVECDRAQTCSGACSDIKKLPKKGSKKRKAS